MSCPSRACEAEWRYLDLCGVVVAPATSLCQQASVGIFQHQAPGVILDEQAAVSGGVQGTFIRLLGFPEGASVGRLSYEHGVIGIFFRYDGRGKHMDAEGTFADRFDGERQLWIVVVGRLRGSPATGGAGAGRCLH